MISPSGVYKILSRHGLRTRWERLARLEGAALETLGLVTERTQRRVRSHVEARQPGDLVSLDCFYVGHLKGVGRVWQLTACDAACSYGARTPSWAPRSPPSPPASCSTGCCRPIAAPGIGPAVLTDNGPEWSTRFRAACQVQGIEARRTRPGHAWINGFVERLQGTILTEHWRVVFRRTYFTRLVQLERALQQYLRSYNAERTHRGYRLQGRTPGSIFSSAR